ncbi:MAG: ABC transporter ATP-binding protein [SAR86 cluster bacterium]|uniref:Probable ATP-binding protein YheS n=1 Tax=SAR86 cluster bacterium TaxID=2030880 RepID=A0A2A5BAB7_9GAMM|nr:MAG: ABC transporter ATP-binding protein [SAR86 cluster bacterium]
MISLNNIMLMRGSQILLRDVSLVIHKGQRTGIIGRNGCGKTSLFKVLSGELSLEEGEIEIPNGLRSSSMAQETPGSSRSALDFVIDAHSEYRALEALMAQAEEKGDDHQLADVIGKLEDIQGYNIKHRAEQLLSGLGFSVEDFDRPVSSFSGGWRVRQNLAAALMCPSDLLLLDEPTNHLDLEATVWLEQWLQQYQGTILLISHDRTFLDSVIDNVISFENNSLDTYKGNYSAFEKLRAERMGQQQVMYEKQQKRRAEIEGFVRRFSAKASKAKQAQSRLKELNRMQDIAPAHVNSPFKFQFPELDQLPSYLLQMEALSIGFDAPLVDAINLSVRSESRFGLLGFNGSGKSTLLKVLSGQMSQLGGEVITARKLRIGYFAQHQVDELNQSDSPMRLLQKDERKATDQEIRDFLGGFDFRGSRIDEEIAIFSGGEKARLALAKVAWQKPNLLLLDEPTNHLDLEMCHALTVALQQYQGAMIVVSHDRHLLVNTVDEFYSIHKGKFAEFKGDLNDYEKWLGQQSSADEGEFPDIGNDKNTDSLQPKLDKKEKRQQAAAHREKLAPLKKQERAIENAIDKLNIELKKIEESLLDEDLYTEAQKNGLRELLQHQGKLKTQMLEKEEMWLEIQEEITAYE